MEEEGRGGKSSFLLRAPPTVPAPLPLVFFCFQGGVQELSFKSMPALQGNVHKILSFLESY